MRVSIILAQMEVTVKQIFGTRTGYHRWATKRRIPVFSNHKIAIGNNFPHINVLLVVYLSACRQVKSAILWDCKQIVNVLAAESC